MAERYLPLYRKYRPQKLEDIVGQAHIKQALTNAIQLNKISHAYLFTGPRGTGKTSTARILAKSLNCINGPTTTPCEQCESCKSITNTIPVDVIELDAASNRSVDDAREILEKVNYAPVHGKYKIYIIDEVHMLTKEAFNALLKTLEEPPENVIFILATTESHKVLDTIKSRCQRFDFKRITVNDITEHLKKIAQKEGIKISDGAISLIAKSAAGGMRDSLALLDQVGTMGASKEITEEDINSLLGRLSFDSLLEISTHIINSDGNSAIKSLEKIYNDGNEPIQILTNLMLFFKNLLITKNCDTETTIELTGATEDQLSEMKKLTENLEKHQILFLINKSAEYIKDLKATTNQQMWLEVGLIDLANLADNTKLMDLEARIARLEGGEVIPPQRTITKPALPPVIEKVVPIKTETHVIRQEETERPEQKVQSVLTTTDAVISETPVQKQKINLNNADLNTIWMKILQTLLKDNLSGLAQMKAFTSLVQCDENGIVIAGKTQRFTDKLNAPDKKATLVEAIHAVIGETSAAVTIRVRTEADGKIQKVKLPQAPKTIAPPKDLVEQEEEITQEENELLNDSTQKEKPTKIDESGLSDQSKMVKELFDGKVLE